MNQLSADVISQIMYSLDSGMSLRVTARAVGVDRETVLRYKRMRNVESVPQVVSDPALAPVVRFPKCRERDCCAPAEIIVTWPALAREPDMILCEGCARRKYKLRSALDRDGLEYRQLQNTDGQNADEIK